MNPNKDFKYEELTHDILNAAFEVHNALGCGFLEKVYENALVYELKLRKHKIDTQKDIQIQYKDRIVGNYVSDVIVDDKVVLELKAVEGVNQVHKAQLLNYLRGAGYEVGLILNFAKTKLEYKRLVMTKEAMNADNVEQNK